MQTLMPGDKVSVEGPYGRLSVPLGSTPIVVLIAGGIGITPIISILSYLATSTKTALDVKQIVFIWTVRNNHMIRAFQDDLVQAYGSKIVQLHIYNSHGGSPHQDNTAVGSTESPPKYLEAFHGRPDIHKLLTEVSQTASMVGVYACGPDTLMSSVETAVAHLNSSTSAHFLLHTETFAL
eukprot:TRINITY_DN3699_c0_g1_i1.p1 TRINITY_DN3699_c0_g1~~TRINITY_DN3699_c0_g1_i1.p1  ORF type:complete len:209 (+),score=10.84 TRINITY_DN3699_c0_g1_i1:89-628(+)